VAILGTLYIIGSTIINAPIDALISIGIAIVGLPVYWRLKSTIRSEEKYKAS
jgi:APA family basic amino acid/polyamine antiporter